jgi:cell division protein FtsI (penicillin-binding protein 3)
VNNPAVTVAVILDSAVGLHQGGQVAAPVFQRVTQQVLEYLHVPHDMELPANRQVWLAQQHKVKDSDLDETSPDHLGSALEVAEANVPDPNPPAPGDNNLPAGKPSAGSAANPVVPASLRTQESVAPTLPTPLSASVAAPARTSGTVVLDVEQGGIEVPNFAGKSVRMALELAEENQLELSPLGSGLAREQSPAPGTHVAAGSRIVVKFER